MDNTDSATVIEKLKMQFRRHASAEFARFASGWHFEHIISSPLHSQSNGKVENAVKICEGSMKKAVHGHFHPYLALLDYRYISTEVGSSPVQRLFSGRT